MLLAIIAFIEVRVSCLRSVASMALLLTSDELIDVLRLFRFPLRIRLLAASFDLRNRLDRLKVKLQLLDLLGHIVGLACCALPHRWLL